ncbi:hypothetical protein T440DRAFT_516079 [Plenodomus tracheiphilus IPT5]|uniref:Uncharacterized protein n=1 Tax=Plenodomus tracheiphilus IPT5 TaxID=1408161 RepID=A0A6A7BDH7_9PLEO|nr:hypothetical protein T440DRAFT_516079 [Plenodomus tracheiphilus IPT5]
MSGLEVVAAVAAVVSAFHGGAELLSLVKKKRRARKIRDHAQQEFEENQLENSLVLGEQQIGLRYAQDQRELGDYMRVGDVVARDRLVHIALIMQAEIIKSLQLAATHDNAILNLRILHQTSIANRRETFVTLDELKQRILVTRPLARQIGGSYDGLMNRDPSVQTIRTNDLSLTSSTSGEYIPRAITMPSQSESREVKHGLSEYFRTKRSRETPTSPAPHTHSPAHAASINFSAALEELVRSRGSEDRSVIMKDINQIITSYEGLDINREPNDPWDRNQYDSGYPERRDTLTMLNNGDSFRPDSKRDGSQGSKTSTPINDYRMMNRPGYPTYSQNIFDAQYEQQLFEQQYNNSQYTGRGLHPSQQPHLQQPRWSDGSASSSVNSDAVLRHNSGSSQGSNMQPVSNTAKQSPHADQAHFSPISPPPNAPFPQRNEDSRLHPSLSHYASSDEYTPPIAPLAPHRATSQPNATSQAPFRIDTPSNSRSMSQGDAMLPVHKPWPGSQRDPSPMPHPSSTQQYSTIIHEEGDTYKQTQRPQYDTPQTTRNGSSVHSGGSGQTITPSGFEAVEAAASALTNGTRLSGIRQPSVALSIASTDSSGSASIGILPGPRIRSSIRTDTIQSPPAGKERMMDGRPCKDNNYWGFCKGAWTIRENVSKGLQVRTQPSGYYNTKQMWECTACSFQGDMFSAPHPTKKNKSIEIVDPRIHISMAGIRYRWIFLAKSHVKKKPVDNLNDDCNYGCVICSAEGNVTGVYGGVESLMNHITLTHVADMSEKTRKKVNCVLGRVAGASEEFDINVPIFAQVGELAG